MALPPETVLRPGHTDPTTVGEEWENNAFVRVWRGLDPEGDEPCTALGEPATLVLLGDDYDGGHKAWVRWPDGRDDIVPGLAGQRRRPRRAVMAREGRRIPTSPAGRARATGRAPGRRRQGGQAGRHARGEPRRADEEAARRRWSAARSRPPSRSSPRWGR